MDKPTVVLRGADVLVVDDDPDALDLVQFILGRYGANVRTAASAAEALEALNESPPDVLISDIGMPDEDGYSLIRQVRARDASRGGCIPAVAMTAWGRSEDRQQALAAGFQTHLAKPTDPEELVRAVATLIHAPGESKRLACLRCDE
jgi:CheY-like chemotaxis protein